MAMNPAEIGLMGIVMAVLVGPFFIKRVERNLEGFLFLMSACAVAISKTWHIGLVEEAFQSTVIVGILLCVLAVGSVIRYRRPNPDGMNNSFIDGITLKVIFFEIVVVLGLLAGIVTPIIPFFVLVEVVHLLPIERKARASLMLLACLSVLLGAAATPGGGPYSTIAVTTIGGQPHAEQLLPLSNLLSINLIPYLLLLGLISTLFAGRSTFKEIPAKDDAVTFKNAANLGVRACMFVGALLLVGGAFGVNF
ncbi:MAG: DUF1646 family protein [Methanotrichaceae archaeon]|nr:DUF1646 family protein [Methanotrichaceae archaeon]